MALRSPRAGGPQPFLPTARRRTFYGGVVRFEEEDVSVLGGDLRLAPFGAGAARVPRQDNGGDSEWWWLQIRQVAAVVVWWWRQMRKLRWRAARRRPTGMYPSVLVSLALSPSLSLLTHTLFLLIWRGSSGGPWWWRAAVASDVRWRAWREWLSRAMALRRWPQCAWRRWLEVVVRERVWRRRRGGGGAGGPTAVGDR
jgi:hypothetical protein